MSSKRVQSDFVLACFILLHPIEPPQWLRVEKRRVLVGIEILWRARYEWKQVLCSSAYDLMLRIKIPLGPLDTGRLRSELISYVILRCLSLEWMNECMTMMIVAHTRLQVLWLAVTFDGFPSATLHRECIKVNEIEGWEVWDSKRVLAIDGIDDQIQDIWPRLITIAIISWEFQILLLFSVKFFQLCDFWWAVSSDLLINPLEQPSWLHLWGRMPVCEYEKIMKLPILKSRANLHVPFHASCDRCSEWSLCRKHCTSMAASLCELLKPINEWLKTVEILFKCPDLRMWISALAFLE